jgi:hypothetical protein
MPRKIKRLFFFFLPSRGRNAMALMLPPPQRESSALPRYLPVLRRGRRSRFSRNDSAAFSRRVHPVLHGNTVRSHRLRPESRGLRFYSSSNCHLHTVRRGSLELFNNLRRTRSASVVHGTGRSSLRSALRHQRLYSSTITN